MSELLEVEAIRRGLQRKVVGKEIAGVRIGKKKERMGSLLSIYECMIERARSVKGARS